jgi:hypothetical protein
VRELSLAQKLHFDSFLNILIKVRIFCDALLAFLFILAEFSFYLFCVTQDERIAGFLQSPAAELKLFFLTRLSMNNSFPAIFVPIRLVKVAVRVAFDLLLIIYYACSLLGPTYLTCGQGFSFKVGSVFP